MPEQYGSIRLRNMINVLRSGYRDLTSAVNEVFYRQDVIPGVDELAERWENTAAWQTENRLVPVSNGEFNREAAGSRELFMLWLNNAGIETEFENDLYYDSAEESAPSKYASFASKQKKTTPLRISDIHRRLNVATSDETVAHVSIGSAPVIGDRDHKVNDRIRRIKNWLSLYLS